MVGMPQLQRVCDVFVRARGRAGRVIEQPRLRRHPMRAPRRVRPPEHAEFASRTHGIHWNYHVKSRGLEPPFHAPGVRMTVV